jgi:hypothetical protein
LVGTALALFLRFLIAHHGLSAGMVGTADIDLAAATGLLAARYRPEATGADA